MTKIALELEQAVLSGEASQQQEAFRAVTLLWECHILGRTVSCDMLSDRLAHCRIAEQDFEPVLTAIEKVAETTSEPIGKRLSAISVLSDVRRFACITIGVKLLISDTLSPSETSELLHYLSPLAFSRAFRERTRALPEFEKWVRTVEGLTTHEDDYLSEAAGRCLNGLRKLM